MIGYGKLMKPGMRSFHYMDQNMKPDLETRYVAATPLAAAKKAFSQKLRGKGPIQKSRFWIVESTQGRPKKIFTYFGEKVKAPPTKVDFNGKKIVFKYKIIVKADFATNQSIYRV